MSFRRLLTILRKDLVDAVRDGRVLAVLVIAVGIGVLYSQIIPDEEPRPTANVLVVGAGADSQRVATELPKLAGKSLDLTIKQVPSESAARKKIRDDDADIAIVVPSGLLKQAKSGGSPLLKLLTGDSPPPAANGVASLAPAVIGSLTGTPELIKLQTETVADASPTVLNAFGMKTYVVLVSIIMLLGSVGLMVVPIVLAEELEKRTLEALLLAARGSEVLAAKALLGLIYGSVSTVIVVVATSLKIENPVLFGAGIIGVALSLSTFGLAIAYLFRSAEKVNTWAWVLLIPFIGAAFLAGVPGLPGWLDAICRATPTGQGVRVLANATAGEEILPGTPVAFAMFGAWALLGLFALSRIMQRRGV